MLLLFWLIGLTFVALAVFLLGCQASSAQVVHRDEIDNFTAVLEVERTGAKWDEWGLAGSNFVSWSTFAC